MPTPESQNGKPSANYPLDRPPRRRAHTEEDETVGEAILGEVDDAFGVTDKATGCIWALVKLPFRLVWKLIDVITDIF